MPIQLPTGDLGKQQNSISVIIAMRAPARTKRFFSVGYFICLGKEIGRNKKALIDTIENGSWSAPLDRRIPIKALGGF